MPGSRRSIVASLVLVAALLAPNAIPARAVLAAPTLVAPAPSSQATAAGVRFAWNRVNGADAYRLHVWAASIPSFSITQVTPNDDFVADVDLPMTTMSWSVTSIDSHGVDGGTSSSTFVSADVAPHLLGPADGAVLHYPAQSAHLRAWLPEPSRPGLLFDSDLAGLSGPLPSESLGEVPPLAPGSYRWTAVGDEWSLYGFGAIAAPNRTLSIDWANGTPILEAPANNATVAAGDTVVLRWDPVPGAVAYQVQLDQGSGFVQAGAVNVPMVEVTGLWTAQIVHWRVRATQTPVGVNPPVAGPWGTRTFTVSAPPAPSGLSPAAAASLTAWPVFRWDPIPGAASYRIEFADNAQGVNALGKDVSTTAFVLSSATSIFETPRAPGTSGTLWWHVRAYAFGPGVISPWSGWRQLTVTAPGGSLAAPIATTASGPAACANGVTCATLPAIPILRWNAVAGAALYRVFLHTDGMSAGTWDPFDMAGTALVAPPMGTLKADPYVAHATWSVVACPSAESCPTGPTGAISHFALSLPSPSPIEPTDGAIIQARGTLLSWTPEDAFTPADPDLLLPAVTQYQVDMTRTTTPPSPYDGSSKVTVDGTSLSTEFVNDGESTMWRVTALASAPSQPSGWFTYHHVEPTLTILGPAEGAIVSSAPVLSWSPTGVAGTYHVMLLPASMETTGPWGTPGWSWDTAGATSLQVGDLPPGDYVWNVSENVGPRTTRHFTVTGVPGIQLTSPAPGSAVAADNLDLGWTAYPTAIRYDVLIGPTPNLTWANRTWVGTAWTNSIALPMRLAEQQFYWRVCPVLQGLGTTECSGVGGVSVGESPIQLLSVGAASAATVPGAPTGAAGTRGNGQAQLTWSAPASNGGAPITGYTVTASPGAKTCTTAGTIGCTVSGLTNGTAYTFTVKAKNAVGTGPASAASNVVTPAGPPGAPTAVVAMGGNAQATVSWTAPGSTGGSAITAYKATSSPGAKTCTTAGTIGCTVTGLTNGTAYTFTVHATSGAGAGVESSPSNSVTPATVPGTPVGVSASASGSSILVAWASPGSNGGSAITGYTATSSPGGKSCATVGTLSCSITGLADGSYTVTVTAKNAAGTGAPSAPSSSVRVDTTLPTASAPVAAPSLGSTIGSTVPIKLTWSGGDAGSGISKYEVWMSTNGGAYVLVASPTSATYTRSMTPSTTTTYRFRVRAFDKSGNVSSFAYGPTFHVTLVQQTSSSLAWTGTWSTTSTASASGGSYRYASISGSSASYTFTGRAVGIVATKGTAFGSFKVYLDGVYVGTSSDYATSTLYRQLVYSTTWSTSAAHTIKLVCVATAGHPRIDLDAIVVLG